MTRAENRGEPEALGTRGVKLQSPPMPLPPPPPPPPPGASFMNGRRPTTIILENEESASELWSMEKYENSRVPPPPPPAGFHDGDMERPKVTLMRGDGRRSIPEPDNDWGQGEKMQAHPPPPPPTSPADAEKLDDERGRMFGEASRNEWENAGKKREEEEEEDSEEDEDQDEGVLPEIENEIRNRMKKGDDDKKTTTASSTTKETTSETSTTMFTSSTPTPIVRISTTLLPSTVLVLDPRNKSYLFHSPHPEELERAREKEKRKKKRRNEGPNKARMNREEEEVVDDITGKR